MALRTWSFAVVLLGLGRAMVYPTLLAAIGDVPHDLTGPGRRNEKPPGSGAGGWPRRESDAEGSQHCQVVA